MIRLWLSLFLFTFLSALPFAQAQILPETEPETPPPIDFSTVPDEYLDEAMRFQNKCETNINMNQYYNCECASLAYLQDRIESGPAKTADSIKMSIRGQCQDAANAAGTAYNECIQFAGTMPAGTDPEKHCECVANTYVRLVNHFKPKMDVLARVQFGVQARSICRNPETARRLYPYIPPIKNN